MLKETLKINWLLCVTAGKWQVNSIKEAKNLGFKVCAIDADKNAEGFKVSDHFVCEKLENIEKIIFKIKKLQITVKGIVCFNSDAGVKTASLLREYYNVSGMKPIVANKFISKSLQKSEWVENKIETPKYFVVTNKDDLLNKVKKIGLPFIIKPVDSAGSRGISVVKSLKNINIIGCYEKAIKYSKENAVIIERFIVGVEYVVDVLAVGKKIIPLGLVEKQKVKNTNNTVAISLKTPDFSHTRKTDIKKHASKAFKVLGLESCSGHGELIIDTNGKIWMIEVAARGGGFFVFDKLVPIMSGINLPAEVTKLAMGIRPDKLSILNNHVYLYFFPSKKGKIKEIKGFDELTQFENLQGESFVSIGDEVENASTDGDRLGYLFAWGTDNKNLESIINRAKKIISFTIL